MDKNLGCPIVKSRAQDYGCLSFAESCSSCLNNTFVAMGKTSCHSSLGCFTGNSCLT